MKKKNQHSVNKGIIQSGGNISAKSLAVGDNATAISSGQGGDSDDLAKVLTHLQELERILAEHGALNSNKHLKNSLDAVREEVKKPEPNPITLSGILNSLEKAVSTIKPAATILSIVYSAQNGRPFRSDSATCQAGFYGVVGA